MWIWILANCWCGPSLVNNDPTFHYPHSFLSCLSVCWLLLWLCVVLKIQIPISPLHLTCLDEGSESWSESGIELKRNGMRMRVSSLDLTWLSGWTWSEGSHYFQSGSLRALILTQLLSFSHHLPLTATFYTSWSGFVWFRGEWKLRDSIQQLLECCWRGRWRVRAQYFPFRFLN